MADLAGERWVMQSIETPSRPLLEMEFGKAGMSTPSDLIEANSILKIISLMQHCDVIAMLSEPLVRIHLESGLLERLPVRIQSWLERFGLLTRRSEVLIGAELSKTQLRDIARLIAPLGWHLRLFMPLEVLAETENLLPTLPVDVVLDHMGAPGAAAWSHPNVPVLLRMLDRGHAWIKLGGAYLSSSQTAPWDDMGRLARRLVDHRPDRPIWGTNWPHPTRFVPMPGDNELLDAL